MILISARENFWSDTKLAVQDRIKEVNLAGKAPSKDLTEQDLWSKVGNKNILVLVHGYNNEPEDVHNAYAMIENRILQKKMEYDLVIGYIWPGGDDPTDYFKAKNRANALARRFGIWLREMVDHQVTVDLMGHSMGTRVILKSLKTQNQNVARNVFTMAASVDNESIQSGEEFSDSVTQCVNLHVFHSKHDPVLKYMYSLAEWDAALGLVGPENPEDIINNYAPNNSRTSNIYVVNCKNLIKKHGAYKRTNEIYSRISNFLSGASYLQYTTL